MKARLSVRPWLLAAAASAALSGAGCVTVEHSWSGKNVCPLRRVAASEAPKEEAWLSLLLEGYDARTRRATTPAVDCTGGQVVWSAPAYACTDGEFAGKPPATGPIAREDVIYAEVGPGVWLVWIVTGRYGSGDAMGLVALVEAHREQEDFTKRLVVRGLGVLRSYPGKARLHLEQMGDEAVLVAEGEWCPGAGAPCTRAARLMPLRGGRFEPEVVRGAKGECLEAGLVYLKQQETVRAGESARRVDGESRLAYEPGGIRAEETVLVQELGGKADAPPRLLHRAQDTRVIVVREGRLTAGVPSLWMRMAKVARAP